MQAGGYYHYSVDRYFVMKEVDKRAGKMIIAHSPPLWKVSLDDVH